MEAKLKSVLENLLQKHRSQLSLFLKTGIFSITLILTGLGGVSALKAIFFIALTTLLYARPLLGGYPTKAAFVALLPTSLLSVNFAHGSVFFLPAVIFFSVIFYWILGIKNFLFIRRSRLYYVSALSLFYAMFSLFFLADRSEYFLLEYGAVIFGSYILFREWLALISKFQLPERERVAALTGAFLVAQLLWATALLPIGFINSANMMLLFTFVIAELMVNHFVETISKNFLIQLFTFSALLFLLIYFTSAWTLKY